MQAAALLVFCGVQGGKGGERRLRLFSLPPCRSRRSETPATLSPIIIGGKTINRKQKLGKNPFLPSTQQASPCG